MLKAKIEKTVVLFLTSPLYTFLFFILLGFLVYGDVLSHQFMMDDWVVLFPPEAQMDPPHWFSSFSFNDQTVVYYRPFSALVRYLFTLYAGPHPFYFYLLNILLFSFHISLIYILLNKAFKNPHTAFLSAVLYAVHPINAGFVNYATAHENLFMVICLDLSSILFLAYLDQGKKRVYLFSLLFFLIAMLFQEVAVILPLILFFLVYHALKDGKNAVICLKWYGMTALSYLLFRLFIVKNGGGAVHRILYYIQTADISFCTYLSSVLGLIIWYLKALLIPSQILLFHTLQPYCDLKGLLAALGTLSLAVIIVKKISRNRLFITGFLWLMTGVVIPLGISLIYPRKGFIIEPHWFIFSSVGFFILFAACLQVLPLVPRMILITVILTGWFMITKLYNQIWSSQKSYCSYWTSLAPETTFPNYWLADSLFKEGHFHESQMHYQKSLSGRFMDWASYEKMGHIRLLSGDPEGAWKFYMEAFHLNPQEKQILKDLNNLYNKR